MHRKIITICTSYKFKNEAIKSFQKLTDEGYIVLFPAMGCDKHNKEWYIKMHFEKIAMSTEIFVVDVDEYIGESVSAEIAFAKSINVPIRYYSRENIIL